MRLHLVWVVFLKELLETVRDRRTLVRTLILPMILYPVLVLALTKLESTKAEAIEGVPSRVAVWGDLPKDVMRTMTAKGKLTLLPWEGASPHAREVLATPAASAEPAGEDATTAKKAGRREPADATDPLLADARAALAQDHVDAVVALPPTFAGAIEHAEPTTITVYVDSVHEESALAGDRLDSALERASREVVDTREDQSGLGHAFSRPWVTRPRDVAPGERRAGKVLGLVLPMLLISMCLLGVFMPAIDLTAGEKERGTLQTLLCAPLRPVEILAGKFGAVWSLSMLVALANLLSMALTLRRILPSDLSMPVWAYGATFLLLVPTTFFFSALLLALASFAKDFKDAQNLLMPAYLPMTLVGSVAMIPGISLDRFTAMAPVLNVALLIKALFLGEAHADVVFLTVAAIAVYAALALALAARVFASEDVLVGDRASARAALRKGRAAAWPGPLASLSLYAAVLALTFYGSAALEQHGTALQVAVVELGFFLVPVVGFATASRYPLREVLAIRPARPLAWALALVLGGSAWCLAALSVQLTSPPPEFLEAMRQQMTIPGPFVLTVLMLAVLPAVCEEVMFRGILFAGLRGLGPVAAIVGTAALFGVAHGSVYRFLPTAFLGLLLGYVRERTGSIGPGIVLHMTNNALLLALSRYLPELALDEGPGSSLPRTVVVSAMVACAAGLAGLALRPASAERTRSRPAGP